MSAPEKYLLAFTSSSSFRIAKYLRLAIPGFPHEFAPELASQAITTVLHLLTPYSAYVYGVLPHVGLDIATLLLTPTIFGP